MIPASSKSELERTWLACGHSHNLGRRAMILGIVNATPDSFSDGGLAFTPEAAVRRGTQLMREGADMIDVGGESTRPGAEEVDAREEIRRTLPVVQALSEQGVPVSIDTRKAEVAREAVRSGARVVNDVSGGRFDPALLDVAAKSGAGLILMHMRGTPEDMRERAEYADLIGEVARELRERVDEALSRGVRPEAIVLDPGIGFAKTPDQNWDLLARLDELTALGYPLLVGTSRKSFLAPVVGAEIEVRDRATAATLVAARLAGAALFRVHHVARARTALDVTDRLLEARGS